MEPIFFEILKLSNVPSVLILGIFLFFKLQPMKDIKDEIDKLKKEREADSERRQALLLAITKLEVQVENLAKELARTDKLERDMHEVFSQIREIRKDREL